MTALSGSVTNMISGGIKTLFCRFLVLVLLSGTGLVPATETQTAELESFRYTRLAIPEKAAEKNGFYSIRLDADFFRSIGNLAGDLRIISRNTGEAIPWQLQKLTAPGESYSEEQLSGKIVREQILPDGRRNVIFELDRASDAVTAIELVGGKIEPGTVLSIFVGDGLNSWQTAVDKLELSPADNLPDSSHRRFPFRKTLSGKALRLTWEKGKINNLEAVRVFTHKKHNRPDVPVITTYDSAVLSCKQSGRNTVIICRTDNLPLTQLKINSPVPLYQHRVSISGSEDRRNWQQITTGTIRKIDLDRAEVIDFPENRSRFMQIVIENTIPEQLAGWQIEFAGNSYNWLLPAKAVSGGEKAVFTVFYGASSPVSAAATISEPYSNQPLTACRTAEQTANPLRKASMIDRKSWHHLAGALIVIFAGIAIISAAVAAKRSGNILPAD